MNSLTPLNDNIRHSNIIIQQHVNELPDLDPVLQIFIQKCENGQKIKLTNNIIKKIKESNIQNEYLT